MERLLQHTDTRWWLVAALLAVMLGLSVTVIPPYLTIAAIVGLLIVSYLLTKPRWCFLATLFTLPWLTVQVAYIHLTDVFLWLTLGGLILQKLFGGRETLPSRVKLSTGLDWWIIPLWILLFFKGVTSLDPVRGTVYAVRYMDGFILFYLIVYMLRSGVVSLKTLLLTLLYSTLLTCALGMFQNLTGKGYIAREEWSKGERNYFAFLGLGSKTAQQALGTFWHFAAFGHFLSFSAMIFLPFLIYVLPRTKKWLTAYFIVFWTIVVTYSRGALSSFIGALTFFAFVFPKPKKIPRLLFIIRTGIITLIGLIAFVMLFTHYSDTLNERDDIWQVHSYYFKSHPEIFWFGGGIESRNQTALNYIPKYITYNHRQQWEPHNLYIIWIHHMGVMGLVFYLIGLGYVFSCCYKSSLGILTKIDAPVLAGQRYSTAVYKPGMAEKMSFNQNDMTWWAINAGLPVGIVSILIGGTNDHVFSDPYLFTWMLVAFSIRFASVNRETAL